MDRLESPRWVFPESKGLLTGADGGSSASNFRGDPIKAICKENLQNPIDARPDKNIPAHVEFHAFNLPADSFPGRIELADAIKRAKETAQPEGNSREEIFYADAEKYISLDSIPFLRISDSKTTGLVGSDVKINDVDALRNSNWLHLVRGMGMTTKHNGDGGSHGKGKSAAIANSALSTIFYSTKDLKGKLAFQGVAYLPLFVDHDGILRAGVGFYGHPDEQTSPIRECISLDPSYSRTEAGTDIYIAGFSNGDRWEDRLLVCVLNEYLLAIYKEILVVQIGDITVDLEHLPDLITRYAGYNESDTPPYLVREEHIKKVLADKTLEEQIREKFEITLKVGDDDYYYQIAVLVAFHYHNVKTQSGCSPQNILDIARDYGISKIAAMSVEAVGALMEELRELNVLQKIGNGNYRFTRLSFCEMMGLPSDIDDKMMAYSEG